MCIYQSVRLSKIKSKLKHVFKPTVCNHTALQSLRHMLHMCIYIYSNISIYIYIYTHIYVYAYITYTYGSHIK